MRRLALQGLLVAIFLSMGALAQTSFNYAAINVPGAKMTVANGINNSNVIVGSYVPNGSTHTYGFRLHSGAYSKISVPNSTRTSAGGINDYGDVVGTYSLPGTTSQPANSHGFLLHAGVYKTINCPNGKFTSARSINKYGEIVG